MSDTLRIHTTGYRGPLTEEAYMPPGIYTVGDALDITARLIPLELAQYLIDTEQVTVPAPIEEYASAVVDPPGDDSALLAGGLRSDAVPDLTVPDEDPGDELPTPDDDGESDTVSDLADDLPEDDLELLDAFEDDLERLTIDELRELAAGQGIEVPAARQRKADLIALIKAQLD